MNTPCPKFRSNFFRVLLAAVAGALVAASGSTRAQTVYSLQVQATTIEPGAGDINFRFPFTIGSDTLSASHRYDAAVGAIGCCSGSYAVSGSATDLHGGTVTAFASGDGVFAGSTLPEEPFAIPQILFGQVAAFATIKSSFQVVGPASTTPIHVGLDWQMSASADGSGSAFADLVIYGGCSSCLSVVFHSTVIDNGNDGGTFDLQLLPNQPYAMIATARAADSSTSFNASSSSGSGSASVDPLFSLPAGSENYHFVGLPATATAITPVPEPSVMALVAAGLAVVGFRSRRARHA